MTMQAYTRLTSTGRARRLRRLAEAALDHYDGLDDVQLTLLSNTEHALFRVDVSSASRTDGRRFVLRIYHPDAYDAASVAVELAWLAALCRETELVVPEPVPARDGALRVSAEAADVPEPRACALFRWVDGRRLKARLSARALERVGRFVAKLHRHAEQYIPPTGPSGQSWSWERVFGDGSVVGPASTDPLLAPEQRAVFTAVAELLRDAMEELGAAPDVFGLIHADLHSSNYLFLGKEVRAIDFEDCGPGYYLYDLAVTIDELEAELADRAPELRAALLRGYREVRPLSERHEALLDLFVAMRLAELVRWYGSTDNAALRVTAGTLLAQAMHQMTKLVSSSK